MMLPDNAYIEQQIESDFCLIKMSDFNSLIAKSQDHQTPVFQLAPDQIGLSGDVLKNTLKAQEIFKEAFSTLADRVIQLTSYAADN